MRAIADIAWEGVSLIHTLIFRMLQKKLAIIYIVKLVIFTCGMEFCILTIIENAIIFTVADIYEQEPTSGEFLSTHFKNTIL